MGTVRERMKLLTSLTVSSTYTLLRRAFFHTNESPNFSFYLIFCRSPWHHLWCLCHTYFEIRIKPSHSFQGQSISDILHYFERSICQQMLHYCFSLLFIAANKAVQLKGSVRFYWCRGGLVNNPVQWHIWGGGRPDTHTDQIFFKSIGFF